MLDKTQGKESKELGPEYTSVSLQATYRSIVNDIYYFKKKSGESVCRIVIKVDLSLTVGSNQNLPKR